MEQQRIKLMKHQSEAIAWTKDRTQFGLYMEMRLGKTISYIRWAQTKADIELILVVAPVDALRSWWKELKGEGEIVFPAYYVKGSNARRELIEAAFDTDSEDDEFGSPLSGRRRWVLLNYEGLRTMPDVANMGWDAVCLDEVTYIRNPQAKITQVCLKGFRNVKYRADLSGLPNPESELDFCCPMLFKHDVFMGCKNYWSFRAKYFEMDWNGKWKLKPETKRTIHAAVHERAFIMRRAEAKVGPKKVYTQRYVSLDDAEMKKYRDVERTFATEELETQWIIVMRMWLARMSGGFIPTMTDDGIETGIKPFHTKKINLLMDLLTGELYGEQVVVWFRFNAELKAVSEQLHKHNITHGSMYGEVSPIERTRINELFDRKQIRVVLAQIKCAKMGVNFSVSDTAIYYSNSFSFEERSQSEDRIIHIGKQTPQLIMDLITEHTIDEDILSALNDKSVNSASFLMDIRKRVMDRMKRNA